MTTGFDYLKDPAAIYAQSFDTVAREARPERFGPDAALVTRLVHACGMPEIADDLVLVGGVLDAAAQAIRNGGTILCDCEMVRHGITARFLPPDVEPLCTLNDERVPALAEQQGTTRSAAAVTLWPDRLSGAVVAIGNAPTALFQLMEDIQSGKPKPAAIFAFPVGFVGAQESKQALIGAGLGIPFATLPDRRGGSAMAAAAVNATLLAAGETS
ncbi:MAG: precorrin-8X methylmutase [Magnetovibrionaceae bacterium]